MGQYLLLSSGLSGSSVAGNSSAAKPKKSFTSCSTLTENCAANGRNSNRPIGRLDEGTTVMVV